MKKSLLLFGIFILIMPILLLSLPNESSGAQTFTYVPANLTPGTTQNLCLGGGNPGISAGTVIKFAFPADTLDNVNITNGDLSIWAGEDSSDVCSGTEYVVEDTETADNDLDYGVIDTSGSLDILTITFEDGYSSGYWGFEIKNFGTVSMTEGIKELDVYLDNGVAGSVDGIWDMVFSDLLFVGETNLIDISATIDPTLSLTLSSNTCDLGTFDSTQINTCNYSIEVDTNALHGYSAYINGDSLSSGSHNFVDAGGTVTNGTEGYGVSTTESATLSGDAPVIRINDFDALGGQDQADCIAANQASGTINASTFTSENQQIAVSSGAVNDDTTYLCHAASISSATPAGGYSATVTITATGNF